MRDDDTADDGDVPNPDYYCWHCGTFVPESETYLVADDEFVYHDHCGYAVDGAAKQARAADHKDERPTDTTMSDNNDDDDSSTEEKEYAVMKDDDLYDVFRDEAQAKDLADWLTRETPRYTNVAVVEQPLGESGHFEPADDEPPESPTEQPHNPLDNIAGSPPDEFDVDDVVDDALDNVTDALGEPVLTSSTDDSTEQPTAADTTDTMDDYTSRMFAGSTDIDQTADTTESYEVRKWKLGKHSAQPTVSEQDLSASAQKLRGIDNDMADMFENAAQKMQHSTVGDFECPVCGIAHGHSDDKHDIRDDFRVSPVFADQMEFVANCHCGVNELAMLMDYYDDIASEVFTDAPLSKQDLSDRKNKIRNAASNATIGDTTEERIERLREKVERSLGVGDDARTDGSGTVEEGP